MAPEICLQYVTIWGSGGIESFVMNMFANIDRTRVTFDVATCTAGEAFYDGALAALGGKKHVWPLNSRFKVRRKLQEYVAFYRLVKRNRYALVHIHTPDALLLPLAVAARLAGARKVFVHSHTAGPPGRQWNLIGVAHGLFKHALAWAPTHRCACSRAAARWGFPGRLCERGAVHVLYNGIDLHRHRFDPATRAAYRADMGLDGKLVVGHVGRMYGAEKNQDFLLRVFAELAAAREDCALLLIGDGDRRAGYEALAASLGVTDKVRFLGVRRDVPALLMAMDAFVMPSRFEGLCIAAVEAQAAGLAVVLSDSISNELDFTGRLEFLPLSTPPGDWAAAILRAAERPRANAGDLRGLAQCDARRVAQTLLALYCEAE